MSTSKRRAHGAEGGFATYLSEIIMSTVLLVIICLPLAFAVPMWIQYVLLRVPTSSLAMNPVALFGLLGALAVTVLLAGGSLFLGYAYIIKMKPKAIPEEKKKAKSSAREKAEIEAETVAEDEGVEDLAEIGEEDTEATELEEEADESEN